MKFKVIEDDEILKKTCELVNTINKVMTEGTSTFTLKWKCKGTKLNYKWIGVDIKTKEKFQIVLNCEMKVISDSHEKK